MDMTLQNIDSMMLTSDDLLEIKEMQMKALLDVIRAINSNAKEQELYMLYKLTLKSNIHISRLALFVENKEETKKRHQAIWECRVSHDAGYDHRRPLSGPEIELLVNGTTSLPVELMAYQGFHKILPIRHKNTVLAYVFIGKAPEVPEEVLDLNFVETLTNIVIVAVENKHLAKREQKQQQRLDDARKVQGFLLPKSFPSYPGLEVFASYLPQQTLGGDYYDFIRLSADKFLLCVADVAGKDLPAAILMANFQGGLRSLARQTHSLSRIVAELNHLIYENSNGESFITAFFMTFDVATKRMEFVNAGHNLPFLFVKQGTLMEELSEGATILGAFEELPFLEVGIRENLECFFLFCFTDGFTDSYNSSDEEFSETKLLEMLRQYLSHDLKVMHERLIELLRDYKGEEQRVDDITLFSCRFTAKMPDSQ